MENNNFFNLFNAMFGMRPQTENTYNEIQKLHDMLEDANIPHKFCNLMDGYQVVYYGGPVPEQKPGEGNAWGSKGDVIEHSRSYGHEKDLLEAAGCLSNREDDVEGYLTAEEVFKRIESDYKLYTKSTE